MSKYKPLSERLAGHDGDEWRTTFAEIEAVLGFPLPKGAREQNAWWTGAEKPHHGAWLSGGWRVAEIDRAGQSVTFARAKAAKSKPTPKASAASEPATPAQPSPPERAAPVEQPAPEGPAQTLRKAAPAMAIGGAAALLAGATAVITRFLAKRKGEPWR